MSVKEKVCLIVIDGWGIRKEKEGNAILAAETPTMDKLLSNSIILEASERNVGLPDGQCGNSEVGHLNIGAGRIVDQFILRINDSINTGKFLQNKNFLDAVHRAKTVSNGRIHLFGLCSDGGVHSHIDHILGVLASCKKLEVNECFLHFISDGRDSSPTSGTTFVKNTLDFMAKHNYGKLATVVGRYYAMDRDNHWDRIQIAFDAFTHNKGTASTEETIVKDIETSYAKGVKFTDEYLTPYLLGGEHRRVQDNDTLLFLNFRTDRTRMIVKCFGIDPQFDSKLPKNLEVYCMVSYSSEYKFKIFFDSNVPKNVLAEWLSVQKVKQLHVAETEKYPHVTFFFNGGIEKKFDMEERIMVNSPKVATYDLMPPMSCMEVSQKVVEGIESGQYPFIMLNLAPPDMVGHTGVYDACVKACTATDQAIKKIYDACEKHNYVLMVTSDHGNAEVMIDPEGKPFTAHTLYPVPLIITKNYRLKYPNERKPALCDVATTVLDVMGLPKPAEMTGFSLLDRS